MSTDTTGGSGGPIGGSQTPSGEPSEEELRAAYEAELSRITTTDMIAQAAVSLLNLGARRLGPPPGAGGQSGDAGAGAAGAAQDGGRDLEQARDAIDAARALLGILERTIPQELRPLRDALSQLQMAYAREIQTGGGESKPAPGADGAVAPQDAPADAGEQPGAEERPPGPGPAQASGRLWVPGS